MKINCIAIDDEPLALGKIVTFIEKIDYLKLTAKFDNAFDAIGYLKKSKTDLMFLDIQMDDFTGIQLLETLQNPPKVILTTAYDHFALKGYELDVNDYLLKPISFSRFVKAVEKVYKLISNESSDVQVLKNIEDFNAVKQKEYFFCKDGNSTVKINFCDILFVEGMKDYLKIQTKTTKYHTLLNFSRMEEVLPNDNFIRVHKSYIISIDKINKIERNRIYIGEINIPIGNLYKKDFFETIKSF